MIYYIDQSDRRGQYLLELMRERGYSAFPFSERTHRQGDCAYIFSPAKRFLESELHELDDFSTLYAGRLTDERLEIINLKKIKYVNLLSFEEFSVKNAELTAQGTLALLIEKTPHSIYANKILVLGSGRCAKAIVQLFDRLKLDVTVMSRKKPALGLDAKTLPLDEQGLKALGEFDVIINTIPAKVVPDQYLPRIQESAVFLEIASISSINAEIARFSYIPAPGLPQIYSPQTAALIMMDCII